MELGRRYVGVPAFGVLVRAAADSGLTLIAFEREVPFVEITEAVHARIIDAQLEELRASERLHEVFTELSVAGASPDEIVRQAAILAGRPVILADLSHRVLACEPGSADPARLLAGFARRSRALSFGLPALPALPGASGASGRTVYDEAAGWLFTPVGARGEDWGRVILVCDGPPGGTDTVLIERAATTLALGRLLTRHQESLDRQAHRTLITGIISQAHADPAEAAVRSRALGVPVDGRRLIAMVLRLRDPSGPGSLGVSAHARVLDVADAAAAACRAERIPSLVGTLDDARAGAMLSLSHLVCDGPPSGTDTVLIERAATTLALGRLLTRHQESLDRQAHRTLITGIISQAHADPAEAAVRPGARVPVDAAAHRHGAQAARSFRPWDTRRVRSRPGARRRRRGGRRLPRRADSIPGRNAGRRPRRGHALAQPASRPGSRPGWPGGADQRAGRRLPGRTGDRGRRRGRIHQGRTPLVSRGQPGGRRGGGTPGRLECRGQLGPAPVLPAG